MEIKASFKPAETITFSVTADKTENGSISVSPKSASTGSTVTITVTPDAGYELEKLTVTDSKGNEVALTPAGQNRYTFTMPGSNVEIKASFKPAETITFTDVAEGAYYYDAVLWAAEQGITNGTGNGKFSPDAPCTRAHSVTFLWRYEKEPAEGENIFTDVEDDTWYAKAVAWAAKNAIVDGIGGGRFDPEANVSREQLATILFRYAKTLGLDTEAKADFAGFEDGDKVSSWAADAMSWAVAEGIIAGSKDGGKLYLDPQGDATRAQVALMLMRFLQNEE